MAKRGFKGTLEKQLKVYSAAAAGVLALAPSADAAIHYSGIQNKLLNSSSVFQDIDLNGDTTTDFVFRYNSFLRTHEVVESGQYGAQVIQATFGQPIRLASNYQIKGTLANPGYEWGADRLLNQVFRTVTNGNTYSYANFNNATGFLGVRFHSAACQGSNWNYGWIQYHGTTPTPPSLGSPVSGTIIDWAYEDSCNTPIAAGAKTGPVAKTSVPTFDHWGMIIFMLLLGGLAARMLRRQERENS